MPHIVEINGIKYQQNPEPKKPKYSSSMMKLFTMTAMMSGMGMGDIMNGGGGRKTPPLDYIVKEFELIQNKKSYLSRSDRDWVVRVFHQKFTRITK